MKHAYLIIAHDNFYVLEKLLCMLDDERNDIYLHIDKKCDTFEFDKYRKMLTYSNIFFVKRYDVSWGQYSLIQAELSLFSEAYHPGQYSFYHLLSGTDLPIKSQDYIHDFFDSHSEYEFIMCSLEERIFREKLCNRFNKFWYTQNLFYKILNKIKYNRFHNDFAVSFGSEWVSITEGFLKCILEQKKWIRKHFHHTHACDEIYKQSIAFNSEFKSHLYRGCCDGGFLSSNMRHITWTSGSAHPKILTMKNYNEIIESECLFARKFDENVDKEIIDCIFDSLK